MYYYKALIQYDGSGYAGFQYQKNIPTIQHTFNLALKSLSPGKITTMGASRTDSGVHALSQVVKITSENPLNCLQIHKELNSILPSEIFCLNLTSCPGNFKPTSDTYSKQYCYYFTNFINQGKSIFYHQRFNANYAKKLNIETIQSCIKMLPGTHNFSNFYSAGSNIKSTIRTIYSCHLDLINPHQENLNPKIFSFSAEISECYKLTLEANGFLKQMIRHLVSVLWLVGNEKISPSEFNNYLQGEIVLKKRIWKIAPPNGLFLVKIDFINP